MQATGRVLTQLGFTSPPPRNLAGLKSIYSAWCLSVPFDNVGKLIALQSSSSDPLPGLDANEFFDRWLTHGVGATCWATANALYELLIDVGFEARRVAGSMRDSGYIGHGSVKVRIDGIDWLVDSSLLTDIPIPLTDEVFFSSDGTFAVEAEPSDASHLVWADLPPLDTLMPCRISIDDATHDFYVERYEASRLRSPFNERLYARRNRPGERLVLNGSTRISRTAAGTSVVELSRGELCDSLTSEFGFSEDIVDRWRRSGGLEAAFLPVTAPPPPITLLPPSQR